MNKKILIGSVIVAGLVVLGSYGVVTSLRSENAPVAQIQVPVSQRTTDDSPSATPCDARDWSVEKAMAERMFGDALRKETLPWRLSVSTGTSSANFPFASVFREDVPAQDVTPCQYTVSYVLTDVSSTTLGQSFELDKKVEQAIEVGNWNNEPAQYLTSSSTGLSAHVLLNHAGGPGAVDTIYTQPVHGQNAIRFLKLGEYRGITYPLGSPEMIGDDQCPCTRTVSISVSAPVSLESLSKGRY